MEKFRLIVCRCGEWEEMSEDEPRHKSQYFKWIENTLEEAIYECPICSQQILSKTIDK